MLAREFYCFWTGDFLEVFRNFIRESILRL